jgi:hypothetical protein
MNADEMVEKIADVFGIGKEARKDPSVIIENVKNANRRANCLWEVEQLFTTKIIYDGEESEECPLSWGADPKKYREQFKLALSGVLVLESKPKRPVSVERIKQIKSDISDRFHAGKGLEREWVQMILNKLQELADMNGEGEGK